MEPEVTLETLNQFPLQNANEFASWEAIRNDLRTQNFSIIDIQGNPGRDPYVILSKTTENGQNYYHGTAGEILSKLEDDQFDFRQVDLNRPTEDLIVIQERSTGTSFIAKANEDNTLEPLQQFVSMNVRSEGLWISPQITPDNNFIHDYSVANPPELNSAESNKLTFNTDPLELQKLVHKIELHNEFISSYGIPDEQSPFKAMEGINVSVKELNAEKGKEQTKTNHSEKIPVPIPTDATEKAARMKNNEAMAKQYHTETKTALKNWFKQAQKDLPDNTHAQRNLISLEDPDRFIDKSIVVLIDKETGTAFYGQLTADGQRLQVDTSLFKGNEFSENTLKFGNVTAENSPLLSIDLTTFTPDRYEAVTGASVTGNAFTFEHTPITQKQEMDLHYLARDYNEYNKILPPDKTNTFDSTDIEKAMDHVTKSASDSKHIMELNNLSKSGKAITDEQRITILKSQMTDEQKIVALTFLNDKNPSKTMEEGYKKIQERVKVVQEHKMAKINEQKKGKGKGLAQKTAAGIEKISRTSID